MTEDEKYINETIKEALLAREKDEVPIGAIVVCNNKIIARAHNLSETLRDCTAHAEMQAITMACDYIGGKYLKDCTLYVSVEPCPMCAAALNWAQIKRLVYGASDDKKGFSLYSPSLLHPKTQVQGGILSLECGNLVSNFFKEKR